MFRGDPEGCFQKGVCHRETVALKSCIVHFTNGWNAFLEPKMRAKDTSIDGHVHWVDWVGGSSSDGVTTAHVICCRTRKSWWAWILSRSGRRPFCSFQCVKCIFHVIPFCILTCWVEKGGIRLQVSTLRKWVWPPVCVKGSANPETLPEPVSFHKCKMLLSFSVFQEQCFECW